MAPAAKLHPAIIDNVQTFLSFSFADRVLTLTEIITYMRSDGPTCRDPGVVIRQLVGDMRADQQRTADWTLFNLTYLEDRQLRQHTALIMVGGAAEEMPRGYVDWADSLIHKLIAELNGDIGRWLYRSGLVAHEDEHMRILQAGMEARVKRMTKEFNEGLKG